VDDYFKANYSPATPPRIPQKNVVRAPALHRLSEGDSIDEADFLDPIQEPRIREPSASSPVSPYTVVDHDTIFQEPSILDLHAAAGRKGSESSAGTLSVPMQPARSRNRRSLPADKYDEEPTPFVMKKSDKHKRILGIEADPPKVKVAPRKGDSPVSMSASGSGRKGSFHETNGRSNSPLPNPDVAPFLYQDPDVRFAFVVC
jgi:hypothetical protein